MRHVTAFLQILWATQICARQMALVRPFSTHDGDNLVRSFADWLEPCSGSEGRNDVDLIIVFSQSIQNSTAAINVSDRISDMYYNGKDKLSWPKCFANFISIGVDIPPHEDIYDPPASSDRADWVSGPNRHFERMIRWVQDKYETMYLMEHDSVPVHLHWLDSLMKEVQMQEPFAIIGSRYRGDNWDPFYAQIPMALKRHLNGNAIYNVSSPLLNQIIHQLENEAGTTANAVPYDYRIGQLIEEVRTGEQTVFPRFSLPSPPQTDILAFLAQHPLDDLIKETRMIGNYAATNMIPNYLNKEEVVVHGANMHDPWESKSMGNISLLVSDWSGHDHDLLFSDLEKLSHPFSEIFLVVPKGSQVKIQPRFEIPVHVVHRHSEFHICSVHITSPWFMTVDALHRLKMDYHPMMTRNRKVVASYADPTAAGCFQDTWCFSDLEFAKRIHEDTGRVFRDDDFLYSTSHRDAYCSQPLFYRPSATSFVAFLESSGEADTIYEFFDVAKYSLRNAFVPLLALTRRRSLQANNTTETTCTSHTNEAECLVNDCEWRQQFTSCRDLLDDSVRASLNLVFEVQLMLNIVFADLPPDLGSLIRVVEISIESVIDAKSTVTVEVLTGDLRRVLVEDETLNLKAEVVVNRECRIDDCDKLANYALTALEQDVKDATVDGSLTTRIHGNAEDANITILQGVTIGGYKLLGESFSVVDKSLVIGVAGGASNVNDAVPERSPVVWALIVIAIVVGSIAIVVVLGIFVHQVVRRRREDPVDDSNALDGSDMMADISAPDLISVGTPDNVPSMSSFVSNPPTGYQYQETGDAIEIARIPSYP